MPTITIAGLKGGPGKSTVAISMAVEWHMRGLRVLLIDCDDQRTAEGWSIMAQEVGRDVPLVMAMGDNVRNGLRRAAEPYDVTIVDCPGKLGKRPYWALTESDLGIICCTPNGFDVWTLPDSVAQLRDAQDDPHSQGLDGVVLCNKRDPRTILGRQARPALEQAGLPVLDTMLDLRGDYASSTTMGSTPGLYRRMSRAAIEVRALVDELEQRLAMPRSTPKLELVQPARAVAHG